MRRESIAEIPINIGGQSGHIALRHWKIPNPTGQILSLHGLGVSGAEFAVFAEHMNACGFDVLSPDWIGHGYSTFFHNPHAYQAYWYLQSLNQVMKTIKTDISTHIISVSFGAIIAFVYIATTQINFSKVIFIDLPLYNSPKTNEFKEVLGNLIGHSYQNISEAENELKRIRPSLFEYPNKYDSYFRENRFINKENYVTLRCDSEILNGAGLDSNINYDLRPQLEKINSDSFYIYGNKSTIKEPIFFEQLKNSKSKIKYYGEINAYHPPCLLKLDQIEHIKKIVVN